MNENNMQHGIDWQGQNVSGWFMSEKMNGCRVYWDGNILWSRGGIAINVPIEWKNKLPENIHLDCELYDGVDGVYRCGSAIKYGNFNSTMKLVVFDCPTAKGNWGKRMKYAEALIKRLDFIRCVAWRICKDTEDALSELKLIQSNKGEGLMMRANDIKYMPGRTNKLLKIKYKYH